MNMTESVVETMRRLHHYARPEFIWQESQRVMPDLEFKDVRIILGNLFEDGLIEPFKRTDGRQFWRLKRKGQDVRRTRITLNTNREKDTTICQHQHKHLQRT